MTTRVVLAPDKFKGSLTAAEVAEALSAGMLDVVPGLETVAGGRWRRRYGGSRPIGRL